jgi:outer membrane autotransporter protein
MSKDLDASSIELWRYYRKDPQLFAQLPKAWQSSIKQNYEEALKRQRVRQRHRALPMSILASLAALVATKAKAAPTVYTSVLTGTSADTAYNTSTDANGDLIYHFSSGDSISTTGVGTEDTYGINLQTNGSKVILQIGTDGTGQLGVSTLRPAVGTSGTAEGINVENGATLTVNGNATVYAQSNDPVPNSWSGGVNVSSATATFNGTTSITTYTPGYSDGLNVYQSQVTFNGDTSITAQARGSSTNAIYNSGGGRSSITMNGNVTLVAYGIWPSDDVHGIYNDNENSKLTINGNLTLTATSNGSTVMGIRNQGNLRVSGDASIVANGPRSAYGIDNTFVTSRMYVGGDLTVSVSNSTGYVPFGNPTGLSNLYGMGASMTFGGASNVSITAVTEDYAINNNGVISFTNADKTSILSASTSCSTCDVYGILNNGGNITFAGGLDVSESTSGTGHRYAIWNVATDGDASDVTVNQAGDQSVKIDGDVLTGSVKDAKSGTVYYGVTTVNFDDSSSYLKGLVLGDTLTGITTLSFSNGASWIPTGTGTLANDFGTGSLTIGTGSAIDLAAAWGTFSPSSIPSYSLRTLEINSTASSGASVSLANGAVFTLLSNIRGGQADEVVFGSGITSFSAKGTQDIRIAYDPVLNSTSWVSSTALQKGVSIAASSPIVIVDASAAASGSAVFQSVAGVTSQWDTTYENALVRFSYVPQVSLSSNGKQILLTGIEIMGNGTSTSSSGGTTTSSGSSGGSGTTSTTSTSGSSGTTSTVTGATATSSTVASTGSKVAITPATGVLVAADAVRAASNIWQVEEEAVSRRSESSRLGDPSSASGLWVDTEGGDFEGGSNDGRPYRQSETSTSIGAERQIDSGNGDATAGLVYTHTDSHATLQNGNATLSGDSLGAYGTWNFARGWFADTVARVGQLRDSYASVDSFGTAGGRYRARAASLSGRMGRRFQGARGFYIEPHVQAAYGSIGSSNYTASNNVRFAVNQNHTFLTRAGVLAGKTFVLSSVITGDVYARASAIHTVGGRPDITASLDGGSIPVVLPTRHGTAGEAVAGGRLALARKWSVFAEAGRTSRDNAVPGGWHAAAGVRVAFD